ncbi:hypothetical protein K435DRAFT_851149 [Dendrothele bispora CBS 962.96]|uniref:DUF6589 domain-containing protein n=1 Tax=Dendrothele bispora (strain CBS 962.96) TaxID=1314807 RepID=A0A4S8MPD4_DENBC|nr:hypothetical protein K435DRAFT_851149 [Dendrothele bispora CBS 962.96]
MADFVDSLAIEGGNNQTRAKLTKLRQMRGKVIVEEIFRDARQVKEEIKRDILQELSKEGCTIQKFLTRSSQTSISQLLKEFSMDNLAPKLQELAPTLWNTLMEASGRPKADAQRDAELVLTTICAMISILRSQKANSFQAVIGMFLLTSGASKREMEVLHHAGLSLSYSAVIAHLDQLLKEAKETYRKLLGQCRRSFTKSHRWQLKRIALERIKGFGHLHKHLGACPPIDPINLHVTEQYPLPAMHLEESSIDSTIQVYEQIMRNLDMTDEALEKHGLMFTDGDLLTDSLISKVEGAHRNTDQPVKGMKGCIRRPGLFHGKVAGCRMTINEHWGKPHLKQPGSGLGWENNLLGWKPMVAGWQGSKATEWKPAHELLQISLAAHIVDGFCIFCGQDNLEVWAENATWENFENVSNNVYKSLFTTKAYDKLKKKPYRDTVFENNVLYNRDALCYIEMVYAIKGGDIGRVINVLKVLATFPEKLSWLVNLTGKADGFKEVDLLQEHQNFWAKIIFSAKGSNRSWEWLSMITICIFELRNAMRTVQNSFKISSLGVSHTIPDMSKEIETLAKALEVNKVQEYVKDRPENNVVKPVRDLLEEGARYPNTYKAFGKFREDRRTAVNLGMVDPTTEDATSADPGPADEELESWDYETQEYTEDDLWQDEEEPYEMLDRLRRFINTVEF